jgi:hypothetical protein
MKVKIKMLCNDNGSEDGIIVSTYMEGKEYEVGQSLADGFFQRGSCELAEEKESNEKAISEAPKNKAIKQAQKNKGE